MCNGLGGGSLFSIYVAYYSMDLPYYCYINGSHVLYTECLSLYSCTLSQYLSVRVFQVRSIASRISMPTIIIKQRFFVKNKNDKIPLLRLRQLLKFKSDTAKAHNPNGFSQLSFTTYSLYVFIFKQPSNICFNIIYYIKKKEI